MAVFPLTLPVVAVFLEYSGMDLWWVSKFYDYQHHLWLFKHYWLFDNVIHTGGQYLIKGITLLWFFLFASTFFVPRCKSFRKSLMFFFLSTAIGPILVSLGKSHTHIYTPWDLELFQGSLPYIRLLDHVPSQLPVGHAFPAGHASGGYAFVSLYFLMLHFRLPQRFYGLLFALCLGLVFGLGQQVRGAHFPSHDIFSLVICWYSSLLMYFLFYPEKWKKESIKGDKYFFNFKLMGVYILCHKKQLIHPYLHFFFMFIL